MYCDDDPGAVETVIFTIRQPIPSLGTNHTIKSARQVIGNEENIPLHPFRLYANLGIYSYDETCDAPIRLAFVPCLSHPA